MLHRSLPMFLVALLAAIGAPAMAEATDAAAPELVSLSASPSSVDVSDGPADIAFTAHITDDVTGPEPGYHTSVVATSPTGATQYTYLNQTSGTATDGVYTGTFTVPQTADPGDWQLRFNTTDDAGHYMTVNTTTLASRGLPDHVTIANEHPDLSAPELVSLSASPSSVDVSDGPADIAFTAHITDDVTGPEPGYHTSVVATSPTGATQYTYLNRTSGTATDGVYTGTFTVPQTADPGDWQLRFNTTDDAGHYMTVNTTTLASRGLPDHVTIANEHPDLSAPELVSLSASPSSVDVSDGPADIAFTAHITDDVTGPEPGYHTSVVATSPTGATQYTYLNRTSGTATDGVYTGTFTVPQTADPGDWQLRFNTTDDAGHYMTVNTTTLASRGLPDHIRISDPADRAVDRAD